MMLVFLLDRLCFSKLLELQIFQKSDRNLTQIFLTKTKVIQQYISLTWYLSDFISFSDSTIRTTFKWP